MVSDVVEGLDIPKLVRICQRDEVPPWLRYVYEIPAVMGDVIRVEWIHRKVEDSGVGDRQYGLPILLPGLRPSQSSRFQKTLRKGCNAFADAGGIGIRDTPEVSHEDRVEDFRPKVFTAIVASVRLEFPSQELEYVPRIARTAECFVAFVFAAVGVFELLVICWVDRFAPELIDELDVEVRDFEFSPQSVIGFLPPCLLGVADSDFPRLVWTPVVKFVVLELVVEISVVFAVIWSVWRD